MLCFFKQKTAYEMRISDWRSDVCSSDLLVLRAHLRAGAHHPAGKRHDDVGQPADRRHRRLGRGERGLVRPGEDQEIAAAHGFDESDRVQIGRASCRERVCKYVFISGGAVTFKTTKITSTKKL